MADMTSSNRNIFADHVEAPDEAYGAALANNINEPIVRQDQPRILGTWTTNVEDNGTPSPDHDGATLNLDGFASTLQLFDTIVDNQPSQQSLEAPDSFSQFPPELDVVVPSPHGFIDSQVPFDIDALLQLPPPVRGGVLSAEWSEVPAPSATTSTDDLLTSLQPPQARHGVSYEVPSLGAQMSNPPTAPPSLDKIRSVADSALAPSADSGEITPAYQSDCSWNTPRMNTITTSKSTSRAYGLAWSFSVGKTDQNIS